MRAANVPIPAWHSFELLVDTGASMTMIDSGIPTVLGLASHGVTPMLTPSTGATPVSCKTYDVALFIPGTQQIVGHYVPALAVVESDFSAQPFQGLLGRDILANCVLTYIGQSDIFVLSY